jgi:hypothetical protein
MKKPIYIRQVNGLWQKRIPGSPIHYLRYWTDVHNNDMRALRREVRKGNQYYLTEEPALILEAEDSRLTAGRNSASSETHHA